jgi:hypothetical protein
MSDDNDEPTFYIGAPGIPAGWTVLDWAATIKCLDDEGCMRLVNTITPGLSSWEAVGMMTSLLDDTRQVLSGAFIGDDGDDD